VLENDGPNEVTWQAVKSTAFIVGMYCQDVNGSVLTRNVNVAVKNVLAMSLLEND
jgi:hypothetical protein